MAPCTTIALAGAVPCWCLCGARGTSRGRSWCRFSSPPPLPPLLSLPRVPRGACRVSLALTYWYAIPRGMCVPRARSGCLFGARRVSVAWLCVRAPAVFAPPPPPAAFLRVYFARSPCRALVVVVRAPPRFLLESLALLVVGWGGRAARSARLAFCFQVVLRGVGVGPSSSPGCPSLGKAVSVRCPCSTSAGCAVMGSRHRFHSSRLRASVARCGRRASPGRGASCLREGRLGLTDLRKKIAGITGSSQFVAHSPSVLCVLCAL